jgi:hypothetical protein
LHGWYIFTGCKLWNWILLLLFSEVALGMLEMGMPCACRVFPETSSFPILKSLFGMAAAVAELENWIDTC